MLDLAYLARLEWLARFARQIKETKAAAIAEAKQRTREAVSGYILSLVIPGSRRVWTSYLRSSGEFFALKHLTDLLQLEAVCGL